MFSMEPQRTDYDLNFHCLGFPVRVHPLFWLAGLILGASGAWDTQGNVVPDAGMKSAQLGRCDVRFDPGARIRTRIGHAPFRPIGPYRALHAGWIGRARLVVRFFLFRTRTPNAQQQHPDQPGGAGSRFSVGGTHGRS